MSYDDHCISKGCTYWNIKRIPYFSNPDVEYKGKKNVFNIGDSKHNNAQMIRNSKEIVASNRVKEFHILSLDNFDQYSLVNDYVDFKIKVSRLDFNVISILT